jgi:hypothetical protein
MNKSAPFQLRWRGQVTGPFPLDEILRQLDDREIGLWHEIGQAGQWTVLGEYLEAEKRSEQAEPAKPVLRARSRIPPRIGDTPASAAAPNSAPANLQPSPIPRFRSLKLFIVLGVLLGYTGAHNFYAGYWGTAIVQLLLTVATIMLGFGFFVAWFWALIELFVVYTDARGRPMV